jgi:hypothetical protein
MYTTHSLTITQPASSPLPAALKLPRTDVLCCDVLCGMSGGQCNDEAQFSDRRWQMTIMDRKGYLFTGGGEVSEVGRPVVRGNDMWKANIPLVGSTTAAKNSIRNACVGLIFPSCTSGLSCWPGTATLNPNAAATCTLLRSCKLNPDEESSSASALPPASTSSSDSGLSGGMIALIVVLVLGFVVLMAYVYMRSQRSKTQTVGGEMEFVGGAKLLGSAEMQMPGVALSTGSEGEKECWKDGLV